MRSPSVAPGGMRTARGENIFDTKTAVASAAAVTLLRALIGARRVRVEPFVQCVLAELVVERALLGVTEGLVSPIDGLEFSFRALVAGVLIGVQLACELLVGFFDVSLSRRLVDAQLFIQIHGHVLLVRFAKVGTGAAAGKCCWFVVQALAAQDARGRVAIGAWSRFTFGPGSTVGCPIRLAQSPLRPQCGPLKLRHLSRRRFPVAASSYVDPALPTRAQSRLARAVTPKKNPSVGD